eukprot:gene13241-26305_t
MDLAPVAIEETDLDATTTVNAAGYLNVGESGEGADEHSAGVQLEPESEEFGGFDDNGNSAAIMMVDSGGAVMLDDGGGGVDL